MTTAEQLEENMIKINKSTAELQLRYEGHMNLFNAAAQKGDHGEMEVHRKMVHDLIGTIMDNNAMLYMLSNQYQDLMWRRR